MKKNLLIIMLLACSALFTVQAQLKVDIAQKRAVFGPYPWATGIYIQDNVDPLVAGISPFNIVREDNNVITLGRNSWCNVKMNAMGAIQMGFDWDYPNTWPMSSLLRIQQWGDGGLVGCNVIMSDGFGLDGIRVDMGPYSRPFTAYNSSNTQMFYVNQSGLVYSNGVILTSDISLKRNIEPINNSLDKVMKLRGVSYDMVMPGDEKRELEAAPIDSVFKYAQLRTPTLTRELFDEIQKEESRKRIGVIANEVEEILPELVRTRDDGLKAVLYPEIVAVLIEAIKELKAEVDELKEKVSFNSTASEAETIRMTEPVVFR